MGLKYSHPYLGPEWSYADYLALSSILTEYPLRVATASPVLRRKPTGEPGDSKAAGPH